MTRMRSAICASILIAAIMLTGAFTLRVAAHPAGRQSPGPLHQNYSFGVPELLMHAYVQPDGSTRIVYDITFVNAGGPIDIVDVGTPNDDYNIAEMTASVDGQPVTDIRRSTYIDVGVEIHLGSAAIAPGDTGTLHLEFVSPDMVYGDTTNEENASLQIAPTWFDSSVIRGTSTIEIRVTTLAGIEADEVVYQDEPFTGKTQDEQGRVEVLWRYEDVSPTQAYRVGVSFPRRGLTQVIETTFWDILGRWLSRILPTLGAILGVCLPIAVPLFFIYAIVRAVARAAKPNYLPPIAQVEGGGIKRGLTAPEAAVLLELPLNKILGLVVFGMLEKGLVRQTKVDPLTVEVVEDIRVKDKERLTTAEEHQHHRRKAAQQKGTVIHQYEYPFLDMIEEHPGTPIAKMAVIKPMQTLIDGVAAKMKGFDLSDTQDYYRRVIDRAVEQASSIGDVEQREAYLDQYLPWVMMERDYRPVLTMGGYHYWPVWARPIGAGSVAAAGSRPTAPATSGRPASTTTFGDVSASFAGWAETTMGSMAAAILPTTLSKPVASSGSSGGGSSHSSCACACAGCACACACAGGGR